MPSPLFFQAVLFPAWWIPSPSQMWENITVLGIRELLSHIQRGMLPPTRHRGLQASTPVQDESGFSFNYIFPAAAMFKPRKKHPKVIQHSSAQFMSSAEVMGSILIAASFSCCYIRHQNKVRRKKERKQEQNTAVDLLDALEMNNLSHCHYSISASLKKSKPKKTKSKQELPGAVHTASINFLINISFC